METGTEPVAPASSGVAVEEGSLRGRMRYDGLFWRRLAFVAATRGPAWLKRYGPGATAAVIYALNGPNRRGAVANMRAMLGDRGAWSAHRDALEMFHQFALCMTDLWQLDTASEEQVLEDKIDVELPPDLDLEAVLPDDRGLVILTSHFGSWELGSRVLHRFDRPVNLVMQQEPNATVEGFAREWRERHGLKVIRSDTSVFASANMVRALRQGEIVAIQLDRAAEGQVTRPVEFFRRRTPFVYGPFVLARVAEVPLWPVFVARLEHGRYRFLPEPLRRIPRRASDEETQDVLRDVVASFERRVREYPHQWFQFRPFWEVE